MTSFNSQARFSSTLAVDLFPVGCKQNARLPSVDFRLKRQTTTLIITAIAHQNLINANMICISIRSNVFFTISDVMEIPEQTT